MGDLGSTKEEEADDDDIVGHTAVDVSLDERSHVTKAQQEVAQSTIWERMVAQRLGLGFGVVRHIVLWEMRLTVYARTKMIKGPEACIFGVEAASSATGIAGVLGNKGGLVVKFNVGFTTLVFASCHLAAHSHKLEQRNANCQEILRETQELIGTSQLDVCSEFVRRAPLESSATRVKGAASVLARPPPVRVSLCCVSAALLRCGQDHVFWIGDLNYRVDLVTNNPAMLLGGERYSRHTR